jgi:hypothetical protein
MVRQEAGVQLRLLCGNEQTCRQCIYSKSKRSVIPEDTRLGRVMAQGRFQSSPKCVPHRRIGRRAKEQVAIRTASYSPR